MDPVGMGIHPLAGVQVRHIMVTPNDTGSEAIASWISEEAPHYPWDERSFSDSNSIQPQILIQSGVLGDNISDVIQ
jgi:hypothetical protein